MYIKMLYRVPEDNDAKSKSTPTMVGGTKAHRHKQSIKRGRS